MYKHSFIFLRFQRNPSKTTWIPHWSLCAFSAVAEMFLFYVCVYLLCITHKMTSFLIQYKNVGLAENLAHALIWCREQEQEKKQLSGKIICYCLWALGAYPPSPPSPKSIILKNYLGPTVFFLYILNMHNHLCNVIDVALI